MSQPVRVLMVCTGNICRSPTAEAVLRRLAEQAGVAHRIDVDSAGTTNYHLGEPPDSRSQQHAARRGYELSALRARQVRAADYEAFDWLIAIDRGHLAELQAEAPAHGRARIALLMDFADDPRGGEVPDPYYGGAQGFEEVLDRVEAGCRGLLARLVNT
jgi:protein-tyrosine phosphatase